MCTGADGRRLVVMGRDPSYAPHRQVTDGGQVIADVADVGLMLHQVGWRFPSWVGSGFVLLIRGKRAEARFCQPEPDDLGQVRRTRIALLPPGASATATEGVTRIFETDEGLSETLRHLPDCALLLSRDHYVAAVARLADA
jgi:hypothetical protein